MRSKILIIGLDCADPVLVFERFKGELPNMEMLMSSGIYGRLESVIPPITCPAWMSMMTSRNPGSLGFYGFRNRKNYSYDEMFFANSTAVKERTLWDILSEMGKKVIILGVPQTYPLRPVNGLMVTSFLTPSIKSQYTYPPELKYEIEDVVGEYMLDVKEFRTDDKEYLLQQIYKMTEKRFKLAKHFLRTREWDFFMMVEMGVDRIHHGFWKFFDPRHVKYQAGTEYENSILEYYKFIDAEIGEILQLGEDDTLILVVSDHGAKRMDGGICFNEWLIEEEYLSLKERAESPVRLTNDMIDWAKTRAWGSGGYYGRLFLNVKGREPEGTIPPERYEDIRMELKEKLENLKGFNGEKIGTVAHRPQDIYPECKGIPPDLIVIFGNLYWRSVGSVGMNTIHTLKNDTGPDDANHAQHGLYILYSGSLVGKNGTVDANILDIAPTLLHMVGLPIPQSMEGKVILI